MGFTVDGHIKYKLSTNKKGVSVARHKGSELFILLKECSKHPYLCIFSA